MDPALPIRTPEFHEAQTGRRWWVDGDPLRTASFDGFLLASAFETMSIRICKDAEPRINDPALKEKLKGFVGQETQHAKAHHEHAMRLQNWGHDVAGMERRNRKMLLDWLYPRLSPHMRLAWLAGFEHNTLTAAGLMLTTRFLQGADDPMKNMLLWHSAEEVEHRAFAMELMRDQGVGYFTRQLGFILATITINIALTSAIVQILRDAGELWNWRLPFKQAWIWLGPEGVAYFALAGALHYMRPGFFPGESSYEPSADQVLNALPG